MRALTRALALTLAALTLAGCASTPPDTPLVAGAQVAVLVEARAGAHRLVPLTLGGRCFWQGGLAPSLPLPLGRHQGVVVETTPAPTLRTRGVLVELQPGSGCTRS